MRLSGTERILGTLGTVLLSCVDNYNLAHKLESGRARKDGSRSSKAVGGSAAMSGLCGLCYCSELTLMDS